MDSELLSNRLNPVEIKNKEFKKVVLGYSPEQVVGFLDEVAKLWERLQKKEKELHDRLHGLEGEIQAWQSRESELEKLKEQAREEAEKIRLQGIEEGKKLFLEADSKAEKIRKQTEEWLSLVLSEVEEIERRKDNFTSAFRSALDSHYEILKSEETKKVTLAERLSEFLSSTKSEGSESVPEGSQRLLS